ncbi:hypothetical protein EG328_005294 [Venturia inaequalis]|uniref:Uncharacterized protein n=1 Tax=Venturia inaequalis TaxID=5025 RepID=A0A8H3VMZ3_VENIN|nr:hypothetical protein EG328_005294 [Venturia inaequalis]KAE9990900.1 hypothetical protein EG327_000781 [Venturia inaequalis]
MAYRHIDNRFQHRRPRTPSPTRLDYDRALPPLADQPLLELRRPANKDACFAISALSPKISKRGAGDWDSISGRTCLLDRFLGQPIYPLADRDLLPSPSEVIGQLPNSPGSVFPTESNDLWTILSQRRAQNYTERPPARLAIDTSQRVNNQRHVRQPQYSPAFSTESAPVPGRSGLRPHAPPDIATTHHRKSLKYVPRPIYSPALSTESTPVMDHALYDASYVNRSHFSADTSLASQYSPALSIGSAPAAQRSRPREWVVRSTQSTNRQGCNSPPTCSTGFSVASAPSRRRSGVYDSQASSSQHSQRHQFVTQSIHSPAISTDTVSMIEKSRSYIPLARLEGFPIPQAPSMGRRSPVPAPLNIAATHIPQSRQPAFKSPPWSADSASSFASHSSSGHQSSKAPHPKANKFATQTNKGRSGGLESPGGSSMKSLAQTDQGFSSPSSTFSFSPVTPVAMTFDYPLIFETTPTLESIPWDDPVDPFDTVDSIEGSPHDTVVPESQTSKLTPRGRHTDGGGRTHSTETRTRSHSPPQSALSNGSPVYVLPAAAACTPPSRKPAPDPTAKRAGWKDDFDVHREMATMRGGMDIHRDHEQDSTEPKKTSVGAGLDRTARWVMCKSAAEEDKGAFSFCSVASDREAIMRSYFQRL